MKTKNKIPMRQCTGCREMKNKKEMIRVLKTAEDEIVLDATGRKNGRGAYTGKGYLAIVAGDSSDNTKKKFRNMCEFYEVPLYILSDKETLGHAMGKEFRASLAVQDWNFAEAIRKVLQDEEKEL